jgi:DNA-binding NarL/FixJ family response regulator
MLVPRRNARRFRGRDPAMGDDGDGARARTQALESGGFSENLDCARDGASARARAGGFIAVIDGRTFLRECIRRSMQSAFSLPVIAYSTVSELEGRLHLAPKVVILALIEASHEASVGALKVLSEVAPGVPVIVLASVNDVDLARTVVRHGAKGYIPVTTGFEIAIEAVRFVLAGGTYVPMDCLLAGRPDGEASSQSSDTMTARELAVIRAIQQGKPNKTIAYHLNMCESTVKVHVRNVMKKLKAKNRTEVAIKAQTSLLATLAGQTKTTPAALAS